MPSVLSKGAAVGAISVLTIWYNYYLHRKTIKKALASRAPSAVNLQLDVGVDEQERAFSRDAKHFSGPRKPLAQLASLMRILVPSWRSKETFIIILHTAFLILRTWLSVVVAELDGKIVKHLVRGEGKKFLAGLLSWFAISVPATYTNSMIRYLESKLSIAFRTRLTRYVHNMYLSDRLTFYKMLQLDSSISNPDQYITTDIARFCTSLSSFFSNIGKPVLDMIIFHFQLVRGIGGYGTSAMLVIYLASARLLRKFSPPISRLTAEQANLEGNLRSAHSRLITNAEEVAFYGGHEREGEHLESTLDGLMRHSIRVARVMVPRIFLEDFVVKYTWSAIGYVLCALPFLADRSINPGQRMQRFVTNKRIMMNVSDAGGRLMYSIKEMMELSGKTERVYALVSTLHSLRQKKPSRLYEDYDGIRLTNVDVKTPNGDMLVEGLNWQVKEGEHFMVTGPNGVGKTAVMRVVSGLWSAPVGTVERPDPMDIMYIPQRAYLPIGTLRDQVIYPHTVADMREAGRTDQDLLQILSAVHLAYLPKREGGWDVRKEWKDVFSGGEKQRMNLARIFYHRPNYVMLDECTSAVSSDVEGDLYERIKQLGITMVTISHRPSLQKYHNKLLHLDHSWSVENLTPSRKSPEILELSDD
ncbi:ATP-binding cassette long-chain fatty acid transporter pxa1 [Mycoemilia scoparia]|uniref:ATP-binding cassette long-chain fatty acid transporter pxa1 n=1 Tax=Mycoemilia scoparia TaxID=417184 RepID=A0A9W8DUW0_9FUNG|nr:ATP-binding cassette long-chain fatty acid transporter pxa1 [Mycoemilia scoparia]